MKLYYVAVHFEDKQYMGNLKEIGFWENYFVYEIEDHVLSRVDLTRVRLVTFPSIDVAMGWLFASAQTSVVKVSDRGGISDYVRSLGGSYIPYTKERIKYTMTDADIENGVAFAKAVLHEKADRDFENMWSYIKPQPYSSILAQYAVQHKDVESDDAIVRHVATAHAQYDAEFSVLANVLYDTHVMIEQMSSILDVHAVLLHHFKQINDLPTELKDKETNNVQRTAKS